MRSDGTLSDLFWRLGLRLAFHVLRAWWWVRRPHHRGALVAVHVGGAILLVRPSYRRCWDLPGGGVGRGETPEQAARRELQEEVGISGVILTPAGEARGLWDWQRDHVFFFEARMEALPALTLDNREIVRAALAPLERIDPGTLTGPAAIYVRRLQGIATPE